MQRRLSRQGRHVVEGSCENEASRREHKEDAKTGHGHVVEGSYEKEPRRARPKENSTLVNTTLYTNLENWP